ncbi:MAG TPA: GNAT family N-acetyltransferase [Acidimicrobiales bacterium]|nr:GNAT family N-acetyltransferase [Acidimicrobiales bacterium]
MRAPELVTARLTMRGFVDADLEPFAALNADPRVMEFFPSTLRRDESDAMVARIVEAWEGGFGLWALEESATGQFLGFTGFAAPSFEANFTPTIEIGWRLAADGWGRGFATEAATAALAWGAGRLDPPRGEIVSFTASTNVRSRAVMQRLGFTHDPGDDFDHPRVPEGPMRRHVLYRRALVVTEN